MANIGSKQKGGAYPLLPEWRGYISRLFKPFDPGPSKRRALILDPYANEAETLIHWANDLNLEPYAVEMQDTFIPGARRNLDAFYTARGMGELSLTRLIHGDSSNLEASNGAFSIVYLNPPYDDVLITDPDKHYSAGDPYRERFELKALERHFRYVAPNGYVIWVAYAHHMSRKVIQQFRRSCDQIEVFRFPEEHLGHYTQVCVIGRYIKGYVKDTDPISNKNVEDQFIALGKNPESIPSLDKVQAFLNKKGIYRYNDLPALPVHQRAIITFHGKEKTLGKYAELANAFGAQRNAAFAKLTMLPEEDEIIQPLHKPNKRQLAANVAAGMLDNLIMTRNGKRCMLRGSITQAWEKIGSKEEIITQDKESIKRVTETTLIRPDHHVFLLYEDGTVEDVSGADDLSELISDNADMLVANFNQKYKPFYKLFIHPTWRKLLDQIHPGGNPKHKLFKQQKYVICATIEHLAIRRKQITNAQMGFGKASRVSARVYTPDGYKLMRDIEPGDKVINPDGGHATVLATFPQGKLDIYRVTFSDGSSTEVTADHLWSVSTPWRKWVGKGNRLKTTQEIMDKPLAHANGNLQNFIPMVKPVEFKKRDLPLDPYLLGALLGDGSLSDRSVMFTTADDQMVDELSKLIPAPARIVSKSGYDYRISTGHLNSVVVNPVKQAIRALGLDGTNSYTKFIPDDYLYSDVADRLALLQGLLDTDGGVVTGTGNRGCSIEYSTSSEMLASGMKELVQSLGGTVDTATRYPKYEYKGEERTGKLSYRVTIKLPDSIQPFRLTRKTDKYIRHGKYNPTRAIAKIEHIGVDDAKCILLDSENHLYVTDEYIVTHNTPTTAAAMIGLRLLQLAIDYRPGSPLPALAQRYGLTWDDLIAVVDSICQRYNVKASSLRGLPVDEPVIVSVPPVGVNVWMAQEIGPIYNGFKYERILTAKDANNFMLSATANRNDDLIYLGVISYEQAKSGEGVEPAAYKRLSYGREWDSDDEGKERRVIKALMRPADPVTGEIIKDTRGNEVPWERFTPQKRGKELLFFRGNIFWGYAKEYVEEDGRKFFRINRNKKLYSTVVTRKLTRDEIEENIKAGYPKIVSRQMPLYSEVRKFGTPETGNGLVTWNYIEKHGGGYEKEIIRYRTLWDGTMQARRETVYIKPWTIRVIDYDSVKPINPDTEIPDKWLAAQGNRYTVGNGKTDALDKAMFKHKLNYYRVGGGINELDAMLQKKGLQHYTTGFGEIVLRNPRYPVAKYLRKFWMSRIALFVADELHSAKSNVSEVAMSFRDLAMTANSVLGLTGTLYGGKSSSVYGLAYAFSDRVRKRYGWSRGTPMAWVEDMGVRKQVEVRDYTSDGNAVRSGNKKSRVTISEAPGASPMLGRELSEYTLWASLLDLRGKMPSKEELAYEVEFDKEQAALYSRVFSTLRAYNSKCLTGGDRSFLAAYYQNMLCMPDAMHRPWNVIHRVTIDKGAARRKYAGHNDYIVLEIPSLGEAIRPKEQKVIDLMTQDIADGRLSVVAMSQTGIRDIRDRWIEIISKIPGAKPFILNDSVKAADRTEHIQKKIMAGHNVMITNPGLISVAISLTDFSAWYTIEYDQSLAKFSQATARIFRPNQKRRDVVYRHLYYIDHFQLAAVQNIADKTKAAAVLYGAEGGDLAAMMSSEDRVQSFDLIVKAIEEGRQKKKSNAEINAAFSAAAYDESDWADSAWYLPGDEVEDDDSADFYAETEIESRDGLGIDDEEEMIA